jgi:rod shape-determining protein MreC
MKNASYAILICCLFFLINLPNSYVDQMRYFNVSLAAFSFRLKPTLITSDIEKSPKFQKYVIENNRLKTQLDAVKEWLQFDQRIDDLVQKYNQVEKNKTNLIDKEFFRRREEELCKLIKHHLKALPGTVIFRDPGLWSSSCWIDLGKKDNENLESMVVAMNSPVVVGNSLIGIIDYVGKTKSRVRLITDSELIPSVRAISGSTQNQELLKTLKTFELHLQARIDLFDSKEEMFAFFKMMNGLKNKANKSIKDSYLAKGQLHGSSSPIWRNGNILKGIGFNYDYPDEEGPSRDLRTGDPLSNSDAHKQKTILKEGDLLVTTGMDGVFPAGLSVGIVTSIDDLEDGGYAYSLKAKPCVNDLKDLYSIFVLPPLDKEGSFLNEHFE